MKLLLDCWIRRRDLAAFETGELPRERAEALASHLAVCVRCRTEWEELSAVARALRSTPPQPALPAINLWSRIEAEILEPSPARSAPHPLRRLPYAVPVAGAALAAALVLIALPRTRQPSSTERASITVARSLPSARIATMLPVAPPEPPPVVASTPEPTPAPRPKKFAKTPSVKRRPRLDPFTSIAAARPRRIAKIATAPRVPAPIAIVARPPVPAPEPTPGEPEVRDVARREESQPVEVIRVERPAPARIARDAALEADAAERRAEDAMGSPLDAVARASQPRRLSP